MLVQILAGEAATAGSDSYPCEPFVL